MSMLCTVGPIAGLPAVAFYRDRPGRTNGWLVGGEPVDPAKGRAAYRAARRAWMAKEDGEPLHPGISTRRAERRRRREMANG